MSSVLSNVFVFDCKHRQPHHSFKRNNFNHDNVVDNQNTIHSRSSILAISPQLWPRLILELHRPRPPREERRSLVTAPSSGASSSWWGPGLLSRDHMTLRHDPRLITDTAASSTLVRGPTGWSCLPMTTRQRQK